MCDKCSKCGKNYTKHIQSYHIVESENPYRDTTASEVAALGLSAEMIMREGQGLDTPRFGRMFKDFQMEHVIEKEFDSTKPYVAGVDVGFRKPVAEFMNVWMEEGDNIPYVHVFHELAPNDIYIDQLVTDLDIVCKTVCNMVQPVIIGVDKAGDQVKTNKVDTDFNTIKKTFHQAVKNTKGWAVDKNNQVKLLLMLTKVGHLTVDPSCKKLVSAMMSAQYNTNTQGEVISAGWAKRKGIDDPLDALAYALINYAITAELIVPQDKIQEAPSDHLIQMALSQF